MTAQQPSATQPLSHTLASVLQTISSTQQLSNDAIHALSLLVGSSTLIDALDLVDKQSVARIATPSGRQLYQVASSGVAAYTVVPHLLPAAHTVNLGYCPCPAFSHSVLARDNTVICKHLLAVLLAMQLNAFNEKTMGLRWLAGLATEFQSLPQATTPTAHT